MVPLVAVALFLIENGCDLMAKNKRGLTAADEFPNNWNQKITQIFHLEGHRYFMMSQFKFMGSLQLENTVVINTSDLSSFSFNQTAGHTLRSNLAGKLKNSFFYILGDSV